MKSMYGTVRLVSEDALYFFFGKLLFLYITIPLTLVWLLVGYVFDIGDDVVASISGPTYFFIAFFGIVGFKSLYPVAIGMGSTRIQYLKVFYSISLLGVVLSILTLNVLQLILKTVYLQWDIHSKILHPGLIFVNEYNFLTYFWIDLMLGLFLLGIPFLIYIIIFRIGFQNSVILLMLLLVVGMMLYYGGYLDNSMEWLLGLDFDGLKMTLINGLGLCGVGALLLTYPMMRNASLKPKARKE